ncbi:MAG TPA: ABC transporter substrate-binding protein [Limnochordia bacterium]|nr:ABC transporter substrate-binding protein [Limnochordia bacterium]
MLRSRKAVLGFACGCLLSTAGIASAAGPNVYRIGIFEDPTTSNVWASLGPDSSAWNFVTLLPLYSSLYGLADQRFDWVPALAADLPSPLQQETVDGKTYYTSVVPLRTDLKWADGTPFTADDVVFSYETMLKFGADKLGGNWSTSAPADLLDHVEKLSSDKVKFWLKQEPGIGNWQMGVLLATLVEKANWQDAVTAALTQPDPVKALMAADVKPESITGFQFGKWEKGAFWQNDLNPNSTGKGEVTTEYASGGFSDVNPNTGFKFSTGDTSGDVSLSITGGPNTQGTIFSIYQNQNAAILALTGGKIDFVYNPSGLQKGFQAQLAGSSNVATVTNPSNGWRYLAFNLRKKPFNVPEFRQAVATLIDSAYVADNVLQGVALPAYSVVPEANKGWYDPNVKIWGKGLDRAQRVQSAVDLLKKAGFKWEVEPKVTLDPKDPSKDDFTPGSGLEYPDGSKVQPIEMMAPPAGYDPLRATFALWVERWLQDVGIPVRAKLVGFNVIIDKAINQQDFDMFILGWGLGNPAFPDFLYSFWHSSQAEPGGFNTPGYKDPAYDKLAEEFLHTTSLAEAHQLANQMQEKLAVDLPYVVLFTTPLTEGYNKRVKFPYTNVLDGIQGTYGMQSTVNLIE